MFGHEYKPGLCNGLTCPNLVFVTLSVLMS